VGNSRRLFVKADVSKPADNDALIEAANASELGQPSEIGDAAAFLGSNMSNYITGIALFVDGGRLSVL
jgi:NAD(P)-dependent dehydrogenase (short-subunit alcohol dehydrogenase family)